MPKTDRKLFFLCDDVVLVIGMAVQGDDQIAFVGLFLELICKSADLMGIRNQFMAPLRQRNGVVDALKQKAVQFLLQLLDLKGNGRLEITQLFGGFCKAAQLCHMDKCNEIS